MQQSAVEMRNQTWVERGNAHVATTYGRSGFGNAACCGRGAPLHGRRREHRRRRLGGVGAAWQTDAIPRRPDLAVSSDVPPGAVSYPMLGRRPVQGRRAGRPKGTIVITTPAQPGQLQLWLLPSIAVDADLLEHYDRVQRHENALAADRRLAWQGASLGQRHHVGLRLRPRGRRDPPSRCPADGLMPRRRRGLNQWSAQSTDRSHRRCQ